MRRLLDVSGTTAIFLAFLAPGLAAQLALEGVVLDGSGAALSHPTFVIRQSESAVEHVIAGATDGTFTVPRLAPGTYVVTASVPGFASTSHVLTLQAEEQLTLTPAPIVVQVTVVSASRQLRRRLSCARS
jgi:hypothetical protein